MLISYHWLKKFINLKQSPQKVAERITLSLVEVESLIKKGEDTVIEIENKGITNRPDCFSQLGLAREIAAYFNLKLNDPLGKLAKLKIEPSEKIPFSVKVKEPSLCYGYTSIVLTNIKVQPSPKWLKAGVENCGIRSINNVVDATNYVMLELGQPLHAFDYEKIEGRQIIVRKAVKGESILTLDKEKRNLNENVLVIADQKEPIGIAGIIGGAKSEISSETKTIVLESANFNKINNRQSEKFLKLRTEASTRFEKGLDINLTLPALVSAVKLLEKAARAKVASQIIDLKYKEQKSYKLNFSPEWINRFLGLKLSQKEMASILERLQLKTAKKKNQLIVTVPTFRSDLKMPADIAEEIARIYGYDNIPITPLSGPTILPQTNREVMLRKKMKLFLASAGFTEACSTPFLGEKALNTFDFEPKRHLKLINPLTVDQEYLRLSLIPSLLLTAKKNLRYFNKLKLFEIAKTFIPQGAKPPKEISALGALIVSTNSYQILKGSAESFFKFLGMKVQFKPLGFEKNFWQKNQTAKVVNQDKEVLGQIGKIKPKILAKLNLNADLSVLEINFSKIAKTANLVKTYTPIPKYPPIIEHLTFKNPGGILISQVLKICQKTDKLVKKVEIIDTFKDRFSLEIIYRSRNRSLEDKEVALIRKKIVNKLESLGLKLHGKLS